MSDFLNQDLSSIEQFPPVDPYGQFRDGLFYTGKEFFQHLNLIRDGSLWVMTYSASPALYLNLPVERLIVEAGKGDHPAIETRKLQGIHTKLFILFGRNKPLCAYIGSQNLVSPTAENLMVRVCLKSSVARMVRYYEHFWKHAKQCKSLPQLKNCKSTNVE